MKLERKEECEVWESGQAGAPKPQTSDLISELNGTALNQGCPTRGEQLTRPSHYLWAGSPTGKTSALGISLSSEMENAGIKGSRAHP